MSSQAKNAVKKLVINGFKTKFEKELREKVSKKGVLVKLINSNMKRANVLVDILKESDDLNTISHGKNAAQKTDDEYLKKFSQMPKGGPKHSIAVSRAHHLTNFLSEYIINAFQSGVFLKPDIPDHLNNVIRFNCFELIC
jgi:hypothetical protein